LDAVKVERKNLKSELEELREQLEIAKKSPGALTDTSSNRGLRALAARTTSCFEGDTTASSSGQIAAAAGSAAAAGYGGVLKEEDFKMGMSGQDDFKMNLDVLRDAFRAEQVFIFLSNGLYTRLSLMLIFMSTSSSPQVFTEHYYRRHRLQLPH